MKANYIYTANFADLRIQNVTSQKTLCRTQSQCELYLDAHEVIRGAVAPHRKDLYAVIAPKATRIVAAGRKKAMVERLESAVREEGS